MLIGGNFSKNNSDNQAYLARGAGFYRKRFHLPSEWRGSSVWLYLEGVFHETQTWLNGVSLGNHSAGASRASLPFSPIRAKDTSLSSPLEGAK